MKPDETAELKTKMQALIFSIEDGIVMTDFNGGIVVINDAARAMLGIRKGYPYDKKFLEYVADLGVREALETFMRADHASPAAEIKVPSDSGDLWVHVKKQQVTTAKGEALGLVVALHDITVEKNLETLKDDFVQSITHDLKSPITSLQGFLRLFLDGELGAVTDQQRHYMDIMVHSTDRLLKMINNILDLSKLEAGKVTLSKGPWDVITAVRGICDTLQGMARHHRIRLHYNVVLYRNAKTGEIEDDPGSLPRTLLFVDGLLLERVIINLVDNALKFTPVGGEIELRLEDMPDKFQISVRDTGRGIPTDQLEKVFHKFTQVPGTKGGTGLGLTIAKHIVEAHGGQIKVTSQPAKGTTFTFWLPKESEEKAA